MSGVYKMYAKKGTAAHAEPNMAARREAAQLIKQAHKHLVVVSNDSEIDTSHQKTSHLFFLV